MMNITLAADVETVQRTREFARQHGTSVNHLVREFLRGLIAEGDRDEVAAEFCRNATAQPGHSPKGFRFNRDEAHRRRA